ncbi:MAG: hypothetical protein JW723_12800 [Bacteroidales bacterium]|nr:hypothetical protein [Bacteroidales bacterium]
MSAIRFIEKNNDHGDFKAGFDQPGKFIEYFKNISTPLGEESSGYGINYKYKELYKARNRNHRLKNTQQIYPWIQRGPGNVGGRTRSILVDPDDKTFKTWYAGSASGGIWKTTDGGLNWTDLSPDFPNLSTSALVMAESDHNIIYAGTGEGYGGVGMVTGNGIFKSTDRGVTWIQLSSTVLNDDFLYVNVIVVDPANENILIAGTNTGIYKSADGGESWNEVYDESYAVQDIVADPRNFDTLYAAAYGLGILKSVDAGDTWSHAYEGIGEGGRFHLAISPINPDKIYTSAEAVGYDENGIASLQTHIYISIDNGRNWSKFVCSYNFLGTQGWFNNIIHAHPFDENVLYVAGVDFGMIDFLGGSSVSEPQVMKVDSFGTGSFMRFINFGGRFLGGGMSTGDEEDGVELVSTDWSSVEIRFGNGLKQKAHRFTVPEGEGAGVPPEDYSYRDYIDVPFQAWDTDNNRQLMISFRDQERDGKFNLIERDIDDDIPGREYFFIHAVNYNPATPSEKIMKAGGHTYKQLYFFWPTLPGEKIWHADSITPARIVIKYGRFIMMNEESSVTVLADAQKNNNLHVDHHEILTLITDSVNREFIILEANDGGLGISHNEGKTWEQINSGYITTQFYGVAKKPYAHEYIGGMQDNGTWQSPANTAASRLSEYDDKIGGDGFEALWHPQYPHRIIGSSYYNRFYVTNDDGETWTRATQGIGYDDGPFVSRLSHSRANPDLIFAVGGKGVYRHNNFGIGRFDWETIPIPVGWTNTEYDLDALNINVSLANDSIVWAGAGMYGKPDLHIFLSKDRGRTFDSVPNYKNEKMFRISAIATHPSDKKTAYILFSLKSKPKILRTTDFGQTWEDITGFENNTVSSNGFPDVMVYSLLVMPYDTDILWAGTEIGIFESTDNGVSWHYADNGLPAVSVWQMFIQDNHVIVATHGRGIWSLDLNLVNNPEYIAGPDEDLTLYPNPNRGSFYLELNNEYRGEVSMRIHGLDGRLIYSEQIVKNDMVMKREINLHYIHSGEYVLSLEYPDRQTSRSFFVH